MVKKSSRIFGRISLPDEGTEFENSGTFSTIIWLCVQNVSSENTGPLDAVQKDCPEAAAESMRATATRYT